MISLIVEATLLLFLAYFVGYFVGGFLFDLFGKTPVEVASGNVEIIRPVPQAQTGSDADRSSLVENEKANDEPRNVKSDDLKKISGIGPKYEARLNELGVTSFFEIANWDQSMISEFGELVGAKNRIIKDRWVEQAKSLIEDE